MKAKIFLFLVFSFVLSVFAYAEYAPGKIIVKFKPGVIELPKGASIAGIQKTSVRAASVKALAQKYEVSEIEQLFSKALEIQPKWDRLKNDYVFYFPKDQDVLQVVEDFKNNPNVLYVSPCSIVHAFLAPDDPLYSNQYGLTNIKAPQAWDKTTGSSDNVIAVLDTGADSDHADLLARFDPRGWNFVGSGAGSSDFDDDNGHGTGVIGVVGAITSNEVGVAGVDWQAKILPIKVLDSQGNGSIDDIVQGIEYAAALTNNSVDVINMSFGQNSADASLTA